MLSDDVDKMTPLPVRSRAPAGPHSELSPRGATYDDIEVDGYDEIMSSLAEQFSDPGEPNPDEPKPDESFWGPGTADDIESAGGHRGKRRRGGQAKDPENQGRRARPRHAAPRATFGATVARGMTGAKLTSRSAAHAGG